MHVYVDHDDKYYLQPIGEQAATPIPRDAGFKLLNAENRPWFKFGEAYMSLDCHYHHGSDFIEIRETTIDANTFAISTHIEIVNVGEPTDYNRARIYMTACDGYIAGFVTLRIADSRRRLIINVRRDGNTLAVGGIERHELRSNDISFFAVWDPSRKRLHRMYQPYDDNNFPIIDIDASAASADVATAYPAGTVLTNVYDPDYVMIYDGVMTVYEGCYKCTFDAQGRSSTDRSTYRRNICTFGYLVICNAIPCERPGINERIVVHDVRTGDTYEIDVIAGRRRDTLIAIV